MEAFAHFGGVPAGHIRYDNLKPAVIKVLLGRQRLENERFVALRSHYFFDSFYCEPGIDGAHEKGGVEGEIGGFRRNHLVPVPKVGSLAELNAVLATAEPFLQPLALSAATRKQASKTLLKALRSGIAASTDDEPAPLERLARVRLRTVLSIVTLTGAFYILLPQLANVDDSFAAIRSANWAWLLVAVAMSVATYVASAIGISGAVPVGLPFVPNVEAQMASSFVNRVTPANVGGMALNIRFLRKAGVGPAEAVTAVGLNSLAGGIMHVLLLVVFVALAGRGKASGFKIPSDSKLLVAFAAVLALAGFVSATRRGRRLMRTHVVKFVKQSLSSVATLARSPVKLAMLFGGSAGVTLAYIGALAAAAALHGNVSFAHVGAVYLGTSVIAAAAPTPGGLGALEAALVAGFTGVGVKAGVAVAAVLSYRLATYWLPVLPGWLSLHRLQRANLL